MTRFLGYLVVVALLVGTWGYFDGWFTFATSDKDGTWSFTTDVHKDEIAKDVVAYEAKVDEWLAVIDRKIDDLRNRSQKASAMTKPELERQIEKEEKKKAEAQDALEGLRSAKPEQVPQKKKRLDEVLDEPAPPPPLEKSRQ